MRERTKQEIFDLAFNGLRAQGFRKSEGKCAGKENLDCLYRGPDGLKCAIGHCIADSDYRAHFEGEREDAFEAAGASGPLFAFARELQRAHDLSHGPKNMEHRLRGFAEEHNLTIPEGSDDA